MHMISETISWSRLKSEAPIDLGWIVPEESLNLVVEVADEI